MKRNPVTIVEDTLNGLLRVLIKVYNVDEAKAKQIIQEEVNYLINTK